MTVLSRLPADLAFVFGDIHERFHDTATTQEITKENPDNQGDNLGHILLHLLLYGKVLFVHTTCLGQLNCAGLTVGTEYRNRLQTVLIAVSAWKVSVIFFFGHPRARASPGNASRI